MIGHSPHPRKKLTGPDADFHGAGGLLAVIQGRKKIATMWHFFLDLIPRGCYLKEPFVSPQLRFYLLNQGGLSPIF